jgi:hypothetical protein
MQNMQQIQDANLCNESHQVRRKGGGEEEEE